MKNTEALATANTALSDLWKRHQSPEWRLDPSGRTCLQLETGQMLWLELSQDNAELLATLPVATVEIASNDATDAADVTRALLEEIGAEFEFAGNLDLHQVEQNIVCTIRLGLQALTADRLESVLETLIAVSEAVGDALEAEANNT